MPKWEIFCKVVDNFGDIGVCWRLARQLATEHRLDVTLWVDRLDVFARLDPGLDPECDNQQRGHITVRHWTSASELNPCSASAVIVDAFGCGLPDVLLRAMAARPRPPVWINLEYMSAEDWVATNHGLASCHPELPLTRHFFFPGPHVGTGGLLRERHLEQRRDAFCADPVALRKFWLGLGLDLPRAGERRISMFAYPRAPLAAVLDVWSKGAQPVTVLVPQGLFENEIAKYTGAKGVLAIHTFPFLHQDDYDRLLWACDLNFVRGEDSLVRALWAKRPLVWQIYHQEEGAHWPKLDAFLKIFQAALPPSAGDALRALWHAWNGETNAAEMALVWQLFVAQSDSLALGFVNGAGLVQRPDLAGELVHFAEKASGTGAA